MIYNTNHYTIADLFGGGGDVRYVIPKFQREYIWSRENWQAFFDDIVEGNGEGNFIGSILCVKKELEETKDARELEVVDGQQRMATVSLLLCALHNVIKAQTKMDAVVANELMGAIRRRLLCDGSSETTRVILSDQHGNHADYEALLDELGIYSGNGEVKGRKTRRIYKAYAYFLKRLEGYDLNGLKDMLAWADAVLVVMIEVSSRADAFMLFEGLNDRGVPLAAGDLIKNKLLSELEHKGINVGEAFKGWNKMLDNLVNHMVQERFLRQYYNAFHLARPELRIGTVEKATKANLVRIYETLIGRDAKLLYDELLEDAAALENWLTTYVPQELRFKVEDAVMNGDGVGKPYGVLNSTALVSATRTNASRARYWTS